MQEEIGTVTSRGQVVIPAPFRKSMGIKKGTKVSFRQQGSEIVLRPITTEFIRSLCGAFQPKKGRRSSWELLLEDRRSEK